MNNPYMDVPTFPASGKVELGEVLMGYGDIELEIGFGKGHFLLGRACGNPQTGFWGIETRRKWVHLVGERAAKRRLGNVEVRWGDAGHVLARISPDACLKRVFVNFPDPWWKARHQKRLLISPGLIAQVTRLLKRDGELFVQTDVDFRAEAYQGVLSKAKGLGPANGTDGMVLDNPYNAGSLRELRCREMGVKVFRLLYRREGGAR